MAGRIAPLSHVVETRAVRHAVNAGFHAYARRRTRHLVRIDPGAVQRETLRRLLRHARGTRFGKDHHFSAVRTIADFQNAVPLRTYEDLWNAYLRDAYPRLEDLTWPGHVPYFALTSGTTQGATKYIPVTNAMVRSNLRASKTMLAYQLAAHPDSHLFLGKMFFLGGSTELERPAQDVRQGDLSGIAALRVGEWLRPFTFPPLELALIPDWDEKLSRLAESSLNEPITLVGGVPSWLLMLFNRLLELSGKATVSEVWPQLELVVHGGVKFDPYRSSFQDAIGVSGVRFQETYPCSEGFIAIGDPDTGLLRLMFDHGIFHEFVPVDELGSARPTRHWLGTVERGVNYAIVVSTCAGMWAHVIGDTVRFESLSPPLIAFTGRTKYSLSAFGEHLISEEVEAALTLAAEQTRAAIREWHVGTVFEGTLGHHHYLVEFLQPPDNLIRFRDAFDADLIRRNADYQAHRVEGVGLPPPWLSHVRTGGFEAWMRSRGKLGGQHKLPRMDDSGKLTAEIAAFLNERDFIDRQVSCRSIPGRCG